jgi:hypothetical protein
MKSKGLKARTISSFETTSPDPSDRIVAYTDGSGEPSSQLLLVIFETASSGLLVILPAVRRTLHLSPHVNLD